MIRLLGVVVALLVAASLLLLSVPSRTLAADLPPLGIDFISPPSGPWDDYQRATFRQIGAPIAKIQIPAGFGFHPQHVADLIADGAQTIILRTEDCDFTPARTRADLVDRGFLAVVDQHPEIDWWLEIGNETNVCGMDPWSHRFWTIQTARELAWVRDHGIRLMASMPTDLRGTQIVLSRGADGAVEDRVDAIAIHMYGWYQVADGGGGDWVRIYQWMLANTTKPLYFTEAGIDDAALPKTEKARRILTWMTTLSPRVKGVVLFAIAQGSHWPQYEIDGPMAEVLAGWGGGGGGWQACRYFQETSHSLCHDFLRFWDGSGGLPVFGYPISDREGAVQWTERQRFEAHPTNPEPYRVLLGLLGTEDAAARGLTGTAAFQPRAGYTHDGHRYFPETGHYLTGGFQSYWQSHGLELGDPGISSRESIALFGYPISEEFTDPATGQVTQYFERAVFEWHPENPAPYDILLRRLGAARLP